MAEGEAQDVCGDGGVMKRVLRAGTGDPPPAGARCKIHFTATLSDGTLVDSSAERNESSAPFALSLGHGRLVRGLEAGLRTMRRHERAELVCRADYAYGARGAAPIPPHAAVRYEVELCVWRAEFSREAAEVDGVTRLEVCRATKRRAAEFFAAGEWGEAQEDYFDAARELEQGEMPPARRREAWELLLTCWLNEAQCWLKLEEWRRAEALCTKVLRHDERSVKARFRRAVAYARLDCAAKAIEDLQEARRLEPANKEVAALLRQCKEEEAKERECVKALAQKMFVSPAADPKDGEGQEAGSTPEDAARSAEVPRWYEVWKYCDVSSRWRGALIDGATAVATVAVAVVAATWAAEVLKGTGYFVATT
ncbi:hypothetical protein AB1Y20_016402 [Prymnesium parvum]|uniref:peptidylprolyl isomerase n=1 Tax=Prymnesium parvum TaxID=97485 RepID=A0AB34IF68_PRYPA